MNVQENTIHERQVPDTRNLKYLVPLTNGRTKSPFIFRTEVRPCNREKHTELNQT